MSIPEAPFDGEAHARKEGAWVVAYGKTALNDFVELCRSFFDGCKYYRDETKKLYDATVALLATYVKDANADGVLYGRKNKAWVAVPTGFAIVSPQFAGADGARIYLVNIADYPGVTHLWIDPPDDYAEFPGSMVVVNMPYVTGDAHLAITISPNWTINEDYGTLYNWITVIAPNNPELGEYTNFNSLDGGPNCNQLDFIARHTYQAAARNGVWQLSDATAIQEVGV